MQRKNSGRLSCRHLTELQGLCHDGLFMVPPAAAETNRRRKDDRASYKDTHGNPPLLVRCSRHDYSVLSRESCCAWDTLWDEEELPEKDVRGARGSGGIALRA